jgi:hypothetical protein
MRVQPFELPSYIDGTYYSNNPIIHYYEDMIGMHNNCLVNFYYGFNHAKAVIFLNEESKKKFLAKLVLRPKSTGNQLQDYINWRKEKQT